MFMEKIQDFFGTVFIISLFVMVISSFMLNINLFFGSISSAAVSWLFIIILQWEIKRSEDIER